MKDERRGRNGNAKHEAGSIPKNKVSVAESLRQDGKTRPGRGRRGGAIPAQTKGGVRDEHRKLWGRVKKRFSDNLDKSDEKEAKFVKINADALLDIMKGERTAWGLGDEDYEAVLDEAASFAQEMERLTLPPGAGAALDGEEEV